MDIVKIKKGLKNPVKSYNYSKQLLRGYYYKFIYAICKKNVHIGRNFRVRGNLSIKGPGKVVISDNVQLWGSITPWTYSKSAEILIGNNTILDGTRFGCKKRIEIGDNCLIGECRILDTDFHSVIPDKRNDPNFVLSEPIKIGNNVWMTINCVIMKGVTVGDDSTITPNSVVIRDVPDCCIYGGNPAVLIKEVPRNSR